jgi:hypothetical protein
MVSTIITMGPLGLPTTSLATLQRGIDLRWTRGSRSRTPCTEILQGKVEIESSNSLSAESQRRYGPLVVKEDEYH